MIFDNSVICLSTCSKSVPFLLTSNLLQFVRVILGKCVFFNIALLFIFVSKLGELKLGELLDTPPPGLDEAIAISKVGKFGTN